MSQDQALATQEIATQAAVVAAAQASTARLQGRVWQDLNADELQDDGEAGIAGATVELVRDIDGNGLITSDEVVSTAVTDADGVYSFGNLVPGEGYQLRFATPNGYDASVTNPLFDPMTLQAGDNSGNADIGFFKFASLGNRVWNDFNGNGVQDAGETGRAGVKVELYTAFRGNVGEGGGALGTETVVPGDLVATQLTDANGNYSFDSVIPGEYLVRFVAPDGTVLSSSNVGVNDAVDSDADATTGLTGVYTLASGQRDDSADAGIKPEATSPVADSASVCEDRSVTFNVLANDLGVGLKLVKVAHETAALDTTFKSKAGAISFTADGQVTYKSMTNYYGIDKLVYTLEDASGKQYTQTVQIQVNAVSDAPTVKGGGQTYHWDAFGGWQFYGKLDGKTTWIHNYSVKEFGTFDDSADALQDFGGYNKLAAVGSDVDSLKVIRLYGLSKGAEYATVLFDGQPIDFSNGKTFDVTLADIQAGRLDLKIVRSYTHIKLDWTYIDTGDVQSADPACQGAVESLKTSTTIWTPVALDLNGDGQIGVTGATSSSQKDAGAELGRTVQFDINADGKLDTIEWFDGSGDGILVDNRDGLAATQMNGSRLFGDEGGAFANGYDKLATLDTNSDGILSGEETQGLLLWVDNGDAQVQQGELRTLGESGIASISTQMTVTVDGEGRGHLQSSATREDGSQLMSEDVFFAGTSDAAGLGDLLSGDDSALDALVGAGSVSTTSAAMAGEIGAADWAQSADVARKIVQALQTEAIAG
ncbi:SdrD B-like domain-containing protein [Variovorax soli]|uniref:SdrD B-like domain-containing protein n=1 Tax=Variovorax soli TaxID=376815 RepID=UPI00083855F1|nr:SdrD B-like domain-containing protein [Variovorax soli]